MSIQVGASIVGVKEASKALFDLPKSLRKSAVRSAMKKVLKPVVKSAREKAPKATGEGAKSIKARTNKDLKSSDVSFSGRKFAIGMSVGPDTKHYYMRFHEHGTSKLSANPFLRPAWDMHKEQVLKDFGDELWKSIKKRARTIRRKAEAGTLGKRTTKAIRGF